MKHISKRLLSLLLAAIIVISCMPMTAMAALATVTIAVETPENSQVSAGDTLTLPVTITQNSGVAILPLGVQYDEEVFESVSITKGTVIEGDYTVNASNITWIDSNGETNTATGALFTINLKVKENASKGNTTVSIVATEDILDADYNEVELVSVSATISIAGTEEDEKIGYNNGDQNLTFAQVKADNYNLTKPGSGNYYFAGWFKDLESTEGITKDANGYYVLSADTASGTTFSITESRPKYDESYDETAAYHALWIYDDESVIRAFVLGVVGDTATFYSTTGDNTNITANATSLLKNTLIAVNTTGYVKMLRDMNITGIDLDDGENYNSSVMDLNGNTLTTSGVIKVYKNGNIYESSHDKGAITCTNGTLIEMGNDAVLELCDLSLIANAGHAIQVGIRANLNKIERCDITVSGGTSYAAIYLYGNASGPGKMGIMDECSIDSNGMLIMAGFADNVAGPITNTTMNGSATKSYIGATATYTKKGEFILGSGNNFEALNVTNQLFNASKIEFIALDSIYQIKNTATRLYPSSGCTVVLPAGYAAKVENGLLKFVEAYEVRYYSHDGSQLLKTEALLKGNSPVGDTVSYPNDHLNGYNHLGWALTPNGTELVDLSTITDTTTDLYAVREAVTHDLSTEVTVDGNTYKYASLAEAIAAVGTDYQDTEDQNITFKLFKDETISKGFTMKCASYTVDLNGHTVTMSGTKFISDQDSVNNRKIMVTSTAVNKGTVIFSTYCVLIGSTCPADIEFNNLNLKSSGGMMGYLPAVQIANGVNQTINRDSIKYTFSNCKITDTVLVSAAVPVVVPALITVENTTVNPGNCSNSSVVIYTDKMGYHDMSVSIDTLSIIEKPSEVALFNGVNPTVPEGYAFADSDGDGIWMAECQHTNWTPANCKDPKTCDTCGETEGEANGHAYSVEWNWSEDHTTANVTLTCEQGDDVQTPQVTVAIDESNAGKTVYTATVIWDGETYTDTYVEYTKLVIGDEVVEDETAPETNIEEGSNSVEIGKAEDVAKLDSLTVSNKENVVLKFLADALDSISEKVTGKAEISVKPVETTGTAVVRYEFNVTKNNGEEVDFNGSVEVKIPFTPATGKSGTDYRAYHIHNGKREAVNTIISGDATSGFFASFTIPNFSEVEIAPVAESGYIAGLNSSTIDVYTEDEVVVNVGVSSAGADTQYNAAEVIVTFPNNLLSLDTSNLDALKDAATLDYKTVVNGEITTLTIEQIGEVKNFASDNYVLNFTAKAEGTATVTLMNAAFAHEDNVHKENLKQATINPSSIDINIDVESVVVTLPTDTSVSGATETRKGEDYSFTVTQDPYMDYVVKAVVGENEYILTGTAGENNVYTYIIEGEKVSDDITVTVDKTGKKFDLTIVNKDGTTSEMSKALTYNQDYTFEIPAAKDEKHTVTCTIKRGDVAYNSAIAGTGKITIPGADITDSFTITFTETQTKFDVTVEEGMSGTITGGSGPNGSFEENEKPTLTIDKKPGYRYEVTAKDADGNPVEIVELEDGSYTTKDGISSDIFFSVVEKLVGTVNVYTYLTLNADATNSNSKNMFLVTYTDETLAEGSVPFYGADETSPMLWSEKYQAYCWLVIVDNGTLTAESALAQINVKAGTKADVNYSMDINGSNKIDAADAQFVYNMYKALYSSFDEIGIAQFLAADQNGDALTATGGAITVEDATMIIAAILTGTAQ